MIHVAPKLLKTASCSEMHLKRERKTRTKDIHIAPTPTPTLTLRLWMVNDATNGHL